VLSRSETFPRLSIFALLSLLGAAVGNGPGTLPPTPAMKRYACEEARVEEYEAEAQVLDEESIQLAQDRIRCRHRPRQSPDRMTV
jgi:hypothetical protein